VPSRSACLVGRDDLRRLELVERRALLRKYTAKVSPAILYSDHMEGASHRPDLYLLGRASMRSARTASRWVGRGR
jgi:hypothetical protein